MRERNTNRGEKKENERKKEKRKKMRGDVCLVGEK
jgi:hypothetical protein